MPRLVYVAGPYSSDPEANTNRAIEAASQLIDWGYVPFVPHLSHFIDRQYSKPYSTWMRIDTTFQVWCDSLLRLPGTSPGADKEVEFAKKIGQKVYYDLEELRP